MFTYDLAHWSAFLAAAALLNLSPGPDMAFILGHTVKGGARAGTAAMLGIWTGAFGHVLLAALGLSAIVAASALAFSVVKWAGVAYLLWIGFQALRSKGGAFLAESAAATQVGAIDLWAVYRQGALIDLLNPKVAIFFLAFLPQFVVAGAGPVWAQLLLHGVLIIAVAAVIEPPLVLLGGRVTARLRHSQRLSRFSKLRPHRGGLGKPAKQRVRRFLQAGPCVARSGETCLALWLDRTLGALLIGLGLRLAVTER